MPDPLLHVDAIDAFYGARGVQSPGVSPQDLAAALLSLGDAPPP